MPRGLYIRDVARAAGLTTQAIRYYERRSLVEPSGRSAAGYRVYAPDVLVRVRFIRRAQRLGLSLDEIREVLRLKYSRQSPCDCVRKILGRKLAGLKRRIAQMERLRREIETVLRSSRGRARLPHQASALCPITQAADGRQ